MHPNVRRESPGMCPECGMALVPMKKKPARHNGHKEAGSEDFDKHSGHSVNIFKAKFWVSFILSIPVVAYSDIAEKFLGYTAPQFFGSPYLPMVLSSIIFFYGGSIFITSAYRELRARLPGMMTLIALAISVAYFYSVAITFLGGKDTLFWELATLITIMLLGHWIEMRAVSGAQRAQRIVKTFAGYGGSYAERQSGNCLSVGNQKRRYCPRQTRRENSRRRKR